MALHLGDLMQFDPVLGWAYIPNQTVVHEIGTAKQKVPIYFDTLGLRVRAPGVRYDPEAPTALFVGCSYTFGHGVPYEESFIGRLAATPGFPYQVVNLGVQGYGTDQSWLMLKRYLKSFNTMWCTPSSTITWTETRSTIGACSSLTPARWEPNRCSR
jgi:hypothetical protein